MRRQKMPWLPITLTVITEASFIQRFLSRNHWPVSLYIAVRQHWTHFCLLLPQRQGARKTEPDCSLSCKRKWWQRTEISALEMPNWTGKALSNLTQLWWSPFQAKVACGSYLCEVIFDIQAFCYTTKIIICLAIVLETIFLLFLNVNSIKIPPFQSGPVSTDGPRKYNSRKDKPLASYNLKGDCFILSKYVVSSRKQKISWSPILKSLLANNNKKYAPEAASAYGYSK